MNTWLLICKTSHFNIKKAFSELNKITWPQLNGAAVGDIVYVYVTNPYRAILYCCRVDEINLYRMDRETIPYVSNPLFYKSTQIYMRLERMLEYPENLITEQEIRSQKLSSLQSTSIISKEFEVFIAKKERLFKRAMTKKVLIKIGFPIVALLIVISILLIKPLFETNVIRQETDEVFELQEQIETEVTTEDYAEQVIEDAAVMIDIVGKTLDEAKVELNKIGLGIKLGGSEESDKYETGQIIKQNVKAGEMVEENTTIEVITAVKQEKLVVVPNVVGMDETSAMHRVLESSLNVDVLKEYDANVEHGKVISQSIEGDEAVLKGTTIILTICDSKKTVAEVVGLTKEQAMEVLYYAGFNVEVIEAYSDTIEEGYVMNQSVDSDTKINVGETVVITVSKGIDAAKLESVVGLHYTVARERLESKGFNVIVYEEYREGVEPGYVAEQSIPAGSTYATELGHDTEITLYVNSWRQYRWCKKTKFKNEWIRLSEGETFEEALEEALVHWNYYYDNREYFIIRQYSRYGTNSIQGYIIEQPNEWSEWSYSSIIDDLYICEVEESKNTDGGYSLKLYFFEKKLAMLGNSGIGAGGNQSNPGYFDGYEVEYLVQVR